MYCYVRLLNGFQKSLVYKVPHHLSTSLYKGAIVRVPVQKRVEAALVISLSEVLNEERSFIIRDIINLEQAPNDRFYEIFIAKIASAYFLDHIHFYQKIRSFLNHKKIEEIEAPSYETHSNASVILTDEQQAIVDALTPCIGHSAYAPTLVHGVTGSGKTEVYKALIEKTIACNKSVILMLPEVSLSIQFQHLLTKCMPHIPIFGFHSATPPAAKRLLWKALCCSTPVVIIGVHLPVMLPINNLGLILVDEEHEQGFIEKKHPKLNSKELAIWRARIYNIPIVLGSATPSITSLASVTRHQWKFFSITKRFNGSFPSIKKVVLTESPHRKRRFFWISKQLEDAIKECLNRKEQAIIYLNRRGFSFFVQCTSCGFIFQCPSCSVSLTLHIHHLTEQLLRCHYCDYQRQLPSSCPACKASEKELLKKGIGTQQLVTMLKELFPTARIERADLDTTKKQRSWRQTVTDFEQGNIDILVGTQTITKGYHFPNVTLVGIVWADINLHYPAYNASEVALQQIIQVAGRAGRARKESSVIVQMMHLHSLFDYCGEQKYLTFCNHENNSREEIGYPPFTRLVCIELRHADITTVSDDAQKVFDQLSKINDSLNLMITLLGPALPVVHKIQNIEMRHIFLKAPSFSKIHKLITFCSFDVYNSSVFIIAHQ